MLKIDSIKRFSHSQSFDLEGLKGRYLSCSYAFDSNHPKHSAEIYVLSSIFERFQENGYVKMWYRTEVYYGEGEDRRQKIEYRRQKTE